MRQTGRPIGHRGEWVLGLPKVSNFGPELSQLTTQDSNVSGTSPGGSSETVLIVEDDAEIAEVLLESLAAEGYSVLIASDGKEALDRLQQQTVDLIVLDLRMPVMDGWEFRTRQRSNARIAAIPVIAISADGSPQAEAIDAQAFIRKPFQAEELRLAVARVLLEQQRSRFERQVREAERLTTLGSLAASVGHEINNPLTYVIGNVDVLQAQLKEFIEELVPPPDAAALRQIAELLADIRIGAERIHAVVSDLRRLSRKEREDLTWLNINDVLETSISICWNEIRHRARLRRELALLPPVFANEARLGQVFVNVLVNAVQATLPGSINTNEIRVRTVAAGDDVAIEISDTGVGVPRELQSRIFERSFTTKDGTSGTGIGLAVSRNIVQEHGGRIEVQSEPGRGTTFRVILPIKRAAVSEFETPLPVIVEPVGRNVFPGQMPRVLVVDDEDLVLTAIKRILQSEFFVTTAAQPRDALDLLRAGRTFDVIVCDVMMPDMSGMEFAAEAERISVGSGARVLFMTGGSLVPEVSAFRASSGSPWIEKPFDPPRLLHAVRAIFSLQPH